MYKENIIFPCISWERTSLTFCRRKKYYVFRKKIPSFQITQEISCPGEALFEKTIFSESLMKISYFRAIFWERSSFIYCLRCKIIFSRKRNMIFPNNTRKIIFQQGFFRKTIFSGPLEKENMVFRAVVTMKKYKCTYGIIRCFLHRLCLLHTFNGLVIVRVKFDKKHFQ